ncbi:MAG: UTRA domain-containing protein [Alphaproteobacteria bacterium]|nr:UTRA domain-containing protein [Alphaproteobacteria bacterium]MDE2112591.1 UTRA domain-containing protein [Alphaproteobacteria bacterium]MDE2494076.1 UTRA domain-containing protein [Alphaproteobacteria bacterium]
MWLQIRRALTSPIMSGAWPPGTRLPGELELTARFGTSRMTVNKAIQSLAGDGLVRRRPKLGTVVAERAQERPVFEIWQIADLIERQGGAYAYQLIECRKLKDDPEKSLLLGVGPGTPMFWIRCLHLSDGKPFQLEERLINVEAAPQIAGRAFHRVGPGLWLLAHVPWTDAEHKISAREATEEIADALKVRISAACLVVDRRTWNKGTPVTYARLWHSGAQHSLSGHFQPIR